MSQNPIENHRQSPSDKYIARATSSDSDSHFDYTFVERGLSPTSSDPFVKKLNEQAPAMDFKAMQSQTGTTRPVMNKRNSGVAQDDTSRKEQNGASDDWESRHIFAREYIEHSKAAPQEQVTPPRRPEIYSTSQKESDSRLRNSGPSTLRDRLLINNAVLQDQTKGLEANIQRLLAQYGGGSLDATPMPTLDPRDQRLNPGAGLEFPPSAPTPPVFDYRSDVHSKPSKQQESPLDDIHPDFPSVTEPQRFRPDLMEASKVSYTGEPGVSKHSTSKYGEVMDFPGVGEFTVNSNGNAPQESYSARNARDSGVKLPIDPTRFPQKVESQPQAGSNRGSFEMSDTSAMGDRGPPIDHQTRLSSKNGFSQDQDPFITGRKGQFSGAEYLHRVPERPYVFKPSPLSPHANSREMVSDETMAPNITSAEQTDYSYFPPRNISKVDASEVARLEDQLRKLQTENQSLRGLKSDNAMDLRLQTLHRVSCNTHLETRVWFDAPIPSTKEKSRGHLEGRSEAVAIKYYLMLHKEIPFLVYKEYTCNCTRSKRRDTSEAISTKANYLEPHSESLVPVSESFCQAMNKISEREKSHIFPKFTVNQEIKGHHLIYYYYQNYIKRKVPELSNAHQSQAKLFIAYVEESFRNEYEKVDNLLSRGVITLQYFRYLFAPGQILVTSKDGEVLAYRQEGLPETHADKAGEQLSVSASSYHFDGVFEKVSTRLTLSYGDTKRKYMPIQELAVYPLQHAEDGLEDYLRGRGEKFWRCRHQNYVSYTGWDFDEEVEYDDARFMIDIFTYRKMHPSKDRRLRNDLGPEAMEFEEPPDEEFLLLLPTDVLGYNMQEKKWVKLQVQNINSVYWNKQAFENLVINEDTKELVEALVTNQLAAEKGTDLIEKKGAGLIILLHGGPGTGKTLTAESVAEIAERPLYHVTCGDIGTNPAEVERYLETVLFLGKTWGCVVLLDEADVFLEQRSLADLQRNALVSVFLRILEYYEGILILTSNRVGKFDEAFKSRIQLALHYDDLSDDQRLQIWRNFIKRLEGMEDNAVDIDDIRDNVKELSTYKMNGRQIRNAITTARQLASFKKRKMNFVHLRHVIKVASKFDKYLEGVHDVSPENRIARDEGWH
ncbi:MAG: hypothetical protein M1834_008884 [Cirrosporium novae-zelandiae]|nr:MAG: hypothetical protein M1834_008884 [Cirrosporium novae-zelandiae]